MGTNIILKHTAFLVKQVLKNGFIIIKLLEMKVYCAPAKMNIFFRKKLSVVELYLSSEISYQDLALQEEITNPCMITSWVNRFREAGSDALRPHKKGRKKTLGKSGKNPKIAPLEELSVDTSAEHVKELEDELLKLRIENALLKELRRLRLKDQAKMRERQESSSVSEDNSN